MKKKVVSGVIVFFVLIACGVGCLFYTRSLNKQDWFFGVKGQYIAALYVEGTIEDSNSSYNQEWLLSTIKKLTTDSNNVAIAMYVNSPGGGVYQADEVYFALKEYKAAGKKLYVYMGPLAASGGYYISCPADQIYANRNTLTGSIGVIAGQLIDATELLDDIGITIEAVHSGRNKLMGNFYEEITDEQVDILQSISDECYEQFVSIVSNDRGIELSKVKELADGRVYTAAQALGNHLIDKIDTWDNMITTLKLQELDSEDCRVMPYRYEHKQTFRESLLGMMSDIQNQQAAAKLGLPTKVMDDLQGFNSYPAYLYR